MYRKILFISLVFSLFAPVFSQELKNSVRTCRLVFPEKPGGSPKFVYLYDGDANHRIYLTGVNFSKVIKLKSGDITLVMAPKPISDPENIPAKYPKLRLPKEVRNFYIFLAPDIKNKVLPLRMRMLNIDTAKFDIGDTLWYNFTRHNVVAKLGESKLLLPPGKSAISKKPRRESGYYDAAFMYQPNSTGKYRRITEQRWWLDVESRNVGFVANRGGRLPKIYFFRDFRSKLTDKERKEMEDEIREEDPNGPNANK